MKDKQLREVERLALKAGWTSEIDGGGHLRLTSPMGGYVSLPTTPGDIRSMKNALAKLKAMGLDPKTGAYSPYCCANTWHKAHVDTERFCPTCKGAWSVEDIPKEPPPLPEQEPEPQRVIHASPVDVNRWVERVMEALDALGPNTWTSAEEIEFFVGHGATTTDVEATLLYLHNNGLLRKRGSEYQVGEPEPVETAVKNVFGVHRVGLVLLIDQVAKDDKDAYERVIHNLRLWEGEFHFLRGENNLDAEMFSARIVQTQPVLAKRLD